MLSARKAVDNIIFLEAGNMKGLNKAVKIIMKILEVFHWVGAGLMAGVAICAGLNSDWLGRFIDVEGLKQGGELSVYGFEADVLTASGAISMKTLMLFAIGSILIFALVAMICRNIHLIVKRSESGSPFQEDNIRMIKEIGIFSIAIPVIGFIMSTIIRLVVGVDTAETSVSMGGFVMGIIMFCLMQFFAYGAELEKDVDGLL